jgi:hypothetical protein
MTLENAREEFVRMFFALREDAVHWLPTSQGPDNPFRRRAFVRATFAFVEGTVHVMKRIALAMGEAGEIEFSNAELAVLREEHYELGSGKAQTRKMKVRTLDNVRFAVDSFARAHKLNAYLKVDGPGWQTVQAGLRIRHRLLHPKSSKDLEVSDEEVEIVNAAGKWFQDAVIELFTGIGAVTRSRMLAMTHQSVFDPRLWS